MSQNPKWTNQIQETHIPKHIPNGVAIFVFTHNYTF